MDKTNRKAFELTRRQFLKGAAVAGVGLAIPLKFGVRSAYPFAQSPTNIRKFVTTLPGLGPGGANNIGQYIPLATKTTQTFAGLSTDVYNIAVAKFGEKMHPDLKKATHFWGYYDLATGDQKYLAGVIVAKRGTPVLFNLTNQLPNKELVPIDPTLPASATQTVGQLPKNRIVTHLHGGFTPWFSDGTPFQWFTPSGMTGPSFMNVPGTSPPPGTATYYYPMDQSARFVWYHDHAIGITRTNAYSGIASALLVVDDFEIGLVGSGLLPDLVGIPLIIQDKTFVSANILAQDPTWQWGMESDLWYPHVYETTQIGGAGLNPSCAFNASGRWDYGPCAANSILPNAVDGPIASFYTLPTPASVVAEGFLDTAMVNGAPYPVLNVTDKTFRFRILNGSQARFWHLNLYAESTTPGEPNLAARGPAMVQVGTEGGFLPGVVNKGTPSAPVFSTGLAIHDNTIAAPYINATDVNPDGPFNLLLAPAERVDILIDFTGLAGKSYILYADAPAPFPGGDPRNDYFTGDQDFSNPNNNAFGLSGGAPSTVAGFGPNTRTIMKIVVSAGSSGPMANVNTIATALQGNFASGNQPALLFNDGNAYTPKFPLAPYPFKPSGVARRRRLTLNEDFDQYGRLIQRLGTDDNNFTSGSRLTINGLNNNGGATWGRDYLDAVTENPSAPDIEIWDIYNFTGDTHPIHFHLVNVQIIQRQAFTGDFISGITLDPAGPFAPDDNELGWKETVRMNPGEVTTVIMQFTLPTLPAMMGNPLSPRTGGHEYVWHCHILEHEEHDMMRPLVVT